jgi:hypothetical protein
MFHESRIHDIKAHPDALEACREVLRLTWCLCSGFLIEDPELPRPVLLLNDSITPDYDRYCEYALLVPAGTGWLQVESITLNAGEGLTPEQLLDSVRASATSDEALDSECSPRTLAAHPDPCCHCS